MMNFYLKVGENVPEFETFPFCTFGSIAIFFLPLTFQATAVMLPQTNLL